MRKKYSNVVLNDFTVVKSESLKNYFQAIGPGKFETSKWMDLTQNVSLRPYHGCVCVSSFVTFIFSPYVRKK